MLCVLNLSITKIVTWDDLTKFGSNKCRIVSLLLGDSVKAFVSLVNFCTNSLQSLYIKKGFQ